MAQARFRPSGLRKQDGSCQRAGRCAGWRMPAAPADAHSRGSARRPRVALRPLRRAPLHPWLAPRRRWGERGLSRAMYSQLSEQVGLRGGRTDDLTHDYTARFWWAAAGGCLDRGHVEGTAFAAVELARPTSIWVRNSACRTRTRFLVAQGGQASFTTSADRRTGRCEPYRPRTRGGRVGLVRSCLAPTHGQTDCTKVACRQRRWKTGWKPAGRGWGG